MRIVAQRVSRAAVSADGGEVASIGRGLLLLVGVAPGDTPERARLAAKKVANLRVFSDSEGLMNLSLLDVGGETLVVSQFTLLADARRGRRPSFVAAAPPEDAEPIVEGFADALRAAGVPTGQGVFGARMEVELVNDGPVTLVLDFD